MVLPTKSAYKTQLNRNLLSYSSLHYLWMAKEQCKGWCNHISKIKWFKQRQDICPVWACAKLVRHLYSEQIPNQNILDLQINTVVKNGKLTTIPSSMILTSIRSAVRSLGTERLGFTDRDVGTHSNQSGGAIGMYLAGKPVYKNKCWTWAAECQQKC
jgi:hypothetical protein